MATQAARAWQRMLSGRRLDLLDPSPLDVEIEDVAHGLSRVARWNGQTTGAWPFSVAQHSLLVEALYGALRPSADAAERLVALLHDAPEYVIGDLISPFKAMIGGDYKALENRLMAAVHIRFGLAADAPAPIARCVKRADKLAAYYEAVRLAGFKEDEAERFFGRPSIAPPEALVAPMTPDEAKGAFLSRFFELGGA